MRGLGALWLWAEGCEGLIMNWLCGLAQGCGLKEGGCFKGGGVALKEGVWLEGRGCGFKEGGASLKRKEALAYQKSGTSGFKCGPMRTAETFSAKPVRSEISTAKPQRVAGPRAGSKRSCFVW